MRTPRSGAAPADLGQAGFTLLELLVCLVLLAAMSALVLPRFMTERPPTLQQRATAIVADLARLRQAAMRTGTVQTASSRALAATLPPDVRLGDTVPPDFVFLPTGMANGGIWQLEGRGRTAALRLDWLTGQITIDAP